MSKKKRVRQIPPDDSLAIAEPRSGFVFKPWYAVALLLILCAFFFIRVIFGLGNFWEDMIQLEFPNRIFARDSFLNFEFPHWNPFSYNGMPFFATQLPGVLYPLNLVVSFLPLGLNAFWYCLQLLLVSHFAIAGIGMFYFLKGKRYVTGAAFFGAVAYMFCGFLVAHSVHPMMINIVAWQPLVLLFLDKALRTGSIPSALTGGLILGATTLSGHPQVTAYEFLFVAAYGVALFSALEKRTWTRMLLLMVVLAVGAGVSMVQTLPSIELNHQAARVDWTFEAASEGSMSLRQLLGAVLPKLFGAWTGSDAGTVPYFWLTDSPHSGFYTYWETCFYSGIAILVLAFAFVIKQRKNRFVAVLALWLAFSLAFAMGNHFFLYKLIFDYVPGLNRFRCPGRILFTWNFVLPLFAAAAFDSIKRIDKKDRFFTYVMGGGLVCLGLGLAAAAGFFSSLWPEMNMENRAPYAQSQGLILCLNAVLLLIPVALYVKSRMTIRSLEASLCAALVIDLFVFGMGQHIVKEPQVAQYFGGGGGPLVADIKAQTRDPLSRVSIRQFDLRPGQRIERENSMMVLNKCQGMIDQFQTVEGYCPLSLLRKFPPAFGDSQFPMFLDLLNVSFYLNPSYGRSSPDLIVPNPTLLPRAKMFYRAKVYGNDSLVEEAMKSGMLDYRNELALTENPGIPLFTKGPDPAGTARITRYGANRIALDVETQEPGLLWISEIWFSAWKASVDGKNAKVYCADNSFRAVAVPAGAHKVEFYYSSPYFNAGALITTMTIACSLLVILGAYAKKRRRGSASFAGK